VPLLPRLLLSWLHALNPRRSLRARLALVLGGSGLAFALVTALAADAYQRAELADSLGQAMRREALLMSRGLNIALQERLQQLRQVAAQPIVASGLMEPGELRLLLEAQRTQQPALAWLAVTDAQGRVLVATNALLEGQDMRDEPWFAPGSRAPWIGPRRPAGALADHLGMGRDGRPPQLIDLATPLIDFQGRPLGVLVGRLGWDWLDDLHQSINAQGRRLPGADSLVIDAAGHVLLGPPALLDAPLPLTGLADLHAGAAPRVMAWPRSGDFLTALGRDDNADHGPSASLTVVLRQPVALAFASADVLRQRLLAAGLLATAAFIGLSIWLAARITRPVRALSLAAQRVGRGEAPTFEAIAPRRRDEVAELAHTLQGLHLELARRMTAQQRATARFEALFQGAPVAIYLSVDNRVTMANAACLALFGASSIDQLRGKRTHDLIHPAEHALLDARIARMRSLHDQGEAAPLVDHRIVRLDGAVLDVEMTAIAVDVDGTPGVQVVLRDVTEARRDRALLAQTSRLAQVGGWTLDLASQRGTWTDELARIYDAPPGSAPDLELALSSFDAADRTRVQAAVHHTIVSGEPCEMELPMTTLAGHRRWVRIQGHAVREGDRTLALAGITQDVTARRQAEEAVHELNARLEQRVAERTAQLHAANAELDSFAYAVSHDLRAPLRAMSGFSQALVEDHGPALDAEARGYLDQIIQASHRMGDLIDGLLVLSRSTRGALRADAVDLSALAERVVAELRRGDPQRVVQVDITPGLQATGDARMLDAVLHNLLGNAWKYTGHAKAAHITLTAQDLDGERWFCVNDNGAGFDMAHAGRLFKAFARLHRQDEFPGIGIGLATVQRIIHRHGGQIVAQGRPGDGASFRFTLPARRAAEPLDPALP